MKLKTEFFPAIHHHILFWHIRQILYDMRTVDKSIYTTQQERLQALLRQVRIEAGLRQVDLAQRLGEPQSFVSKYESGQRRLDLVELRQVCDAMGIRLVELVRRFESSQK